MHLTHDELARRFGYHPPQTEEKKLQLETVREVLLDAADQLVELTGGPTPEQTLMVRKLEEAMFWANAAIAQPEGNTSER